MTTRLRPHTPVCERCGTFGVRNEQWDAYCCPRCRVWIEEVCGDEGCPLCVNRPVDPPAADRPDESVPLLRPQRLTEGYDPPPPVRLAADSPVPLGRWIALDELVPPPAWEASERPVLLFHPEDDDLPVILCSVGDARRWLDRGYTHWAVVPWPLPSRGA